MAFPTMLALALLAPSAGLPSPVLDSGEVCHLTQPMNVVFRLDEMPDVMAEFDHQRLIMVEPGEKVRTDGDRADLNLPNRQFLRAYKSKTHVIVWYLQKGGFVDLMHIIGLRMIADEKGVLKLRLASGEHLSGKPCQATQALLDGVKAAANSY